MSNQVAIPQAFFWRRVHSFAGLWIVLFLAEHLLTNSQAALWFESDGAGFVRAVNTIQNLPYLHVIEIFLLGVPLLIHMAWGVKYLRTSKINSIYSDGTAPSLPEYSRNHAYTWQRITSWILLFAIVAHVIQMRFVDYPLSAKLGSENYYMVKITKDEGLYTLAARLNATLYDEKKIHLQRLEMHENVDETKASKGKVSQFIDKIKGKGKALKEGKSETEAIAKRLKMQQVFQKKQFLDALEEHKLGPNNVIAVTHNFGTAELLAVRDTFKTPLMMILYTFFVLAASFHAFNGLWTFLISWGGSLTPRSQILMRRITNFFMVIVALLGLSAIWGSYLITLHS